MPAVGVVAGDPDEDPSPNERFGGQGDPVTELGFEFRKPA
jgi:hypothetical protein